jgi:Flp pilus assembly protein TadG
MRQIKEFDDTMTTVSPSSRKSLSSRAYGLLNSFRLSTSGVAAIEMAFVFPFMVILYLGLVDVTNLISTNRRVTLAASTTADLVTQASTTITGNTVKSFFKAIAPIMEPYSAQQTKVEVFAYRKNGSNVQMIWKQNNGGTCGGPPSTAGMSQLMTGNNDLVTARVCVSYKPLFSYVLGTQPFQTMHELTLRPRESLTLDCTGCLAP